MKILEHFLFKKINAWVLVLALLLGALSTVGFGALVRKALTEPEDAGLLAKFSLFFAQVPALADQALQSVLAPEAVMAAKEQRFPGQAGFSGRPMGAPAYLLLSRYDQGRKRSVVELVDLQTFDVLHTWLPDIRAINDLVNKDDPDFRFLERDHNARRRLLVHPFLSTDGGLIVTQNTPLLKIGYCSELVWQNQSDRFHHSVEQDAEGKLWAPVHIYPSEIDEKYVGSSPYEFSDDGLAQISAGGEVIQKISLGKIYIEHGRKRDLFPMISGDYFNRDPLHLNDIQPALADGPYWQTGDLFLSSRNQSSILLYRPSTNKILWEGAFSESQHDVDILDDHRISVFNNNSLSTAQGYMVDGHNEVQIYDFQTDTVSLYMPDALKREDVRTITAGRAEITDNGGLFIEETDDGRLLYFNPDGSLRWTYVNRGGDGTVYILAWSRLLKTPEQVHKVRAILEKTSCE